MKRVAKRCVCIERVTLTVLGGIFVGGCHHAGPPPADVQGTARQAFVAAPLHAVTMSQREHRQGVTADGPPDSSRLRLVVSLADRILSLMDGSDTVFQTPVAVESGRRLVYGNRSWRFRTPRGERRVLRKITDPVWIPPDWHYAEAAKDHGLQLQELPHGGVSISHHRRLEIRDGIVGVRGPDGGFLPLPTDEHIVFDGRLFIPPIGTRNRQLDGDLGRFAFDLGQGYMIHGTLDEASIGEASTHGCIRVGADDMAWLFEIVPVGARVAIH
jgi:hypothetical protein